jgi:uncharacterized membrane protein
LTFARLATFKRLFRIQYRTTGLSQRVRATLIGALRVLAAVAAAAAERYIPWRFSGGISANAVDRILSIMSSSMLTMTTFSLSIITSAYGSAINTVTPTPLFC